MTKDERRARFERKTAYHTRDNERRARRRERDMSRIRVWWID